MLQAWNHAFRNKTQFQPILATYNLLKMEGKCLVVRKCSQPAFSRGVLQFITIIVIELFVASVKYKKLFLELCSHTYFSGIDSLAARIVVDPPQIYEDVIVLDFIFLEVSSEICKIVPALQHQYRLDKMLQEDLFRILPCFGTLNICADKLNVNVAIALMNRGTF